MLSTALNATEGPRVGFDDTKPGQLAITIGGEPFATYVYHDPKISRPYFADVHAPSGAQVTRTHPPDPKRDVADHPTFHPGIWLTFGDINGSDYWRLAATTKFVEVAEPPQAGARAGTFAVKLHYLAQDDPEQIVCEEICRYGVRVLDDGYLLTWDSEFTSDKPFTFGDQEEMGLGFRVATPIRSEDRARGEIPPGNGLIVDAEGRKNGAEVWGKSADWCDYHGALDGKTVGLAILCHPENFRPSWFHARDYGLLVANAFGRKAFRQGEASSVKVEPGEAFRLRYAVLVYSHAPDQELDLDKIWNLYQQ